MRRRLLLPLLLLVAPVAFGQEPLPRFSGTLKSITRKEILLEVDGGQVMTFRRGKKTRLFNGEHEAKSEGPTDQIVIIEARREMNGDLNALKVTWPRN